MIDLDRDGWIKEPTQAEQDAAEEAAQEHVFRQTITVYALRCHNCGHEFYGPEECECPCCSNNDLDCGDPQGHTISIYAIDGNVEVEICEPNTLEETDQP